MMWISLCILKDGKSVHRRLKEGRNRQCGGRLPTEVTRAQGILHTTPAVELEVHAGEPALNAA